jgi:8-oxo-dGTP pyrophosphatase MutT (NUDIX family)
MTNASIAIYKAVLHAAAHGPFFPDWEFSTIFGFDREQIAMHADTLSEPIGAEQWRALNNSFNNLLGYPHGHDSTLPFSRAELQAAFEFLRQSRIPNAEAMIGATDRYAPRVTVATIVERDGKFLFVEERIQNRLVLNQPAGHLDPHETLIQAAERETLEETGWRVRIDAIVSIDQLETPSRAFLRFAFAATALGHDASQPLDQGIERTLWLSPAELEARRDDHRSDLVSADLRTYLSGQRIALSSLRMFRS